MKKLILLLLSVTLFISCDEDVVLNSHLGKWYLYKSYVNGERVTLDKCHKLTSINIFENRIEIENFSIDGDGSCFKSYEDVKKLTELGDGRYMIEDEHTSIPVEITVNGSYLNFSFDFYDQVPDEPGTLIEYFDIYRR